MLLLYIVLRFILLCLALKFECALSSMGCSYNVHNAKRGLHVHSRSDIFHMYRNALALMLHKKCIHKAKNDT